MPHNQIVVSARKTSEFNKKFFALTPKEKDQLDVLQKAYKQALCQPPNTATTKLVALGTHNKAQEIIDAHVTSQVDWLAPTSMGRNVLKHLGYPQEGMLRQMAIMTFDERSNIKDSTKHAPRVPRRLPEARAEHLQER